MKTIFSIFFILFCFLLQSQIEQNSPLILSEIMKGNEFIGHQPSDIRWSLDGKQILFYWNPKNEITGAEYLYAPGSSNPIRIKDQIPASHHGNQLYDTEVYIQFGNLLKFDRRTNETTCIFKTSSYLHNLQRFRDHVYFQEDLKFFEYNLKSGCIKQLISFKKGKKTTSSYNKTHWQTEEEELFLFIQEQKEKEKWNDQHSPKQQKIPVVYYEKSSVNSIQIDGTRRFVTFRLNEYPKNEETHVENHISEDGHTYVSQARSKVSDNDPNHKLGIYDLEKDTCYYVVTTSLEDIWGNSDEKKKERNIIMHSIQYSDDGSKNVMDIRSYDNKSRWIVSIDLPTGKLTQLEFQEDEAWIGGPGISNWNMVPGTLGWINNTTIYYQSEKTGYSHLYLLNTKTKEDIALTTGNWEVHKVQLSNKKDRFYITANKQHPGNREFYHLMIDSKELLPILTMDGNHEVFVSPDEKRLAVRYSYRTKPWELYTAPNKKGAELSQVTKSTTTNFNNYTWWDPKVISIKAADGIDINARIYSPEKNTKNGAAVIFVHGAGYLQNAHNWWSGYYREYMFHNLLRDNGYTVLDIDYRASKGYGRDHRTAIYRHMGGIDLNDQLDGKQYLVDSLGIDPDRIGIYGGSYGGFITLMALLTKPGEFKCGAAIRSVTDWFHYNHEYTSNILNYPSSDPEAYKQSSPIYFAENLQDRLLMLHGMVDDNVQFQDVVRLSQRFIELKKENWELAVYPVEAHSFKKSYSWTDEYRRIYELFYEELIENQGK